MFYHDEHITIFNDDCRNVLPQFKDNEFDLVLTDYPYGNETDYDNYDDTQENLRKLVDDTMPEILRVSKRALITCGVANVHLFPQPAWILAWITPAGAGSGPWGFSCWQPVLAYGKDPYLQAGLGRRHDYYIKTEASVKNLGNKELGEAHPCPKPLDFWTWLLLRASISETDRVLDPFMGAGTTLAACKDAAALSTSMRSIVGIELSQKYCERALEWYKRQPVLMKGHGL